MDLDTMIQIQGEKAREMAGDPPALCPEVERMAEEKRKTFDLPTNAVKVDPLR